MRKLFYFVAAILSLGASCAYAQPQQTFGNYVQSLPFTNTLGSSDSLYIFQGGVSKRTSPSAFGITLNPILTSLAINASGANALTITQADASTANPAVFATTTAGATTASNILLDSLQYYNLLITNGDVVSTTETFGAESRLVVAGGTGQKTGLRGDVRQSQNTATGGDFIGLSGLAKSSFNNGGTNLTSGALGSLYGMESAGIALSGATNYGVVSGAEISAHIFTGGSAKYRWGLSVVGYETVQGGTSDAALHIGAAGSAPWKTGLEFGSENGIAAMDTAGTLIGTDGVSATIANGIDLSAWTITGQFLKGPGNNFHVSGSGAITATTIGLNTGANSNFGIFNDNGGYNSVSLNNTSITGSIGIAGGATADGALYLYSQDTFLFYSGATQVLSINATGRIFSLKGTAPPSGGSAAAALFLSSTSLFGIYFGSGAPSVSAAKGSLYLRTDGTTTNNRAYINTDGATTWTAITTAG